jgi:cyclopropane fatty-acyl-phospholipid synthase-like methyltransferase
MRKKDISQNLVFKEVNNNLIFIGNFEKLYQQDDNPWGQDGSDTRMGAYYHFSRANIITILNNYTKPNQTLLEVGCGLGHVVDYFSQHSSLKCEGADISSEAIKKAKLNYPKHRFFTLDITSNVISNSKKYDIVLLNQALWYVLENFEQMFLNAYNLLNNNGYFLIVNAFTNDQRYGKEIIDGFGGLVQYVEKQSNHFILKKAILSNESNFLYKDGLVFMQKKTDEKTQ